MLTTSSDSGDSSVLYLLLLSFWVMASWPSLGGRLQQSLLEMGGDLSAMIGEWSTVVLMMLNVLICGDVKKDPLLVETVDNYCVSCVFSCFSSHWQKYWVKFTFPHGRSFSKGEHLTIHFLDFKIKSTLDNNHFWLGIRIAHVTPLKSLQE